MYFEQHLYVSEATTSKQILCLSNSDDELVQNLILATVI